MVSVVDRLLRLWREPGAATADAFRDVYADPVPVNGVEVPVSALVERANNLHAAFDDLTFTVVDQVETSDRAVIAFRMRGRHVGPWPSRLGTVEATGRVVETQTIDVLTVVGGLVSNIVVVTDELGLLMGLGRL